MRLIEFELDGRKRTVPWRDSKRAAVYAAERDTLRAARRLTWGEVLTKWTEVAKSRKFQTLMARFGRPDWAVAIVPGKSNRGRGQCISNPDAKTARIVLNPRSGGQCTVPYLLHEMAHAAAPSGHHWPFRFAFLELLKAFSEHKGDYLAVRREYRRRGLDFGENTVRMHPSDFEGVRP